MGTETASHRALPIIQGPQSLPAVTIGRKGESADYAAAVFTEEKDADLNWLALMLYLSPHIERYADQFQQVLALAG